METKIINIAVPFNWNVPQNLLMLTPQENAFILDIGCQTIKDSRALVASLSQEDIYNKIREETKGEIHKLELDLLVQKETKSKMETFITEHYENQLSELINKNNELQKKLNDYKFNSKEIIKEELDKEREKYEMILNNKEKQVLRITENYEKFLQQTDTKSSKKLGDEGEDNFILLSDTFKDFVGYKLEKKSHQAHKGDFHLLFKDFNVLVDLKKYSGSVQKKELEKIEHDLSVNNTVDFAWLISYDSNVSDWNRFPIMYKWILTDMGLKCIIIVNNLNSNKNPVDTLRNVWSITNELHNIINKTKGKEVDDKEIEKIQERDYNVLQKIKTAQKRLSEMKRNVASMSQITKDIENDIIDIISLFTNEVSKNEFEKSSKIKEWWNVNIEYNDIDESSILTSNEIWTRFKKENKLYVDENKILIDEFKTHIKNFIDVNNYVEKSKKGSIDFVGFKFKDLLVQEESKDEKMEVELTMPIVEKKKKRIIQRQCDNTKIVISSEVDNDIVEQYNKGELNVMDISKKNNLLVWQVVSILVYNKVITKRTDARGYDIYKETDEYKSKITEK